MSAWDEEQSAPPVEPTAAIPEQQPAEVEGEPSPTVEAAPEVESPVVESEALETPEAETLEATEAEEEVIREDIPLADIDTKFPGTSKSLREYAKRLTTKLDEAKTAVEFDSKFMSATPATDLLNDLEAKSPSRFSDLGNAYWGEFKDHFCQSDFGLTHAEIKQRLEGTSEPKREAVPAEQIDPDDLEYLPEPVKARLAKLDELEQKYPELEGKLSKLESAQAETTQAAQKQREAIEQQAQQEIQTDFFTQVTGHATDYLANSGLKALETDPPEVKTYIERVTKELTDRLFNEFEGKEQYKLDGEAISDAITRRDKARVNSYIPKVKVAAEIVLDELSKHHKAAIKAMRSPAKQETKPRPEIIGAASSFVPGNALPKGQGTDAVWEAKI